jgi:hypothetical protein
VYAGVSKAPIFLTDQPEPGLQMVAKCEAGSSGFPTATTLASMSVAKPSTASKIDFGTPPASSRHVVRCLDRAVAVAHDHLGDLALAGPPELPQGGSDPSDWIADVRSRAGQADQRRSATAR